jgi:tripartite-type tricarboxylate transporter receptor subunit TctC
LLVTDLLKRAFDAASRLPEDEQDAVAEWLLAELSSEEEWDKRFAESQGALSSLAREALDEHERGESEELNPGSL